MGDSLLIVKDFRELCITYFIIIIIIVLLIITYFDY